MTFFFIFSHIVLIWSFATQFCFSSNTFDTVVIAAAADKIRFVVVVIVVSVANGVSPTQESGKWL